MGNKVDFKGELDFCDIIFQMFIYIGIIDKLDLDVEHTY